MIETVRFEKALQLVGQQYIKKGAYADFGFTQVAAHELEKLAREAIVLALSVFAYDTRQTIGSIIELGQSGAEEDALQQKTLLLARAVGGYALEKAGLGYSGWNLFEMSDPLGLGLGTELKDWLHVRTLALGQAESWLAEFGTEIDLFNEYVLSNQRPVRSA